MEWMSGREMCYIYHQIHLKVFILARGRRKVNRITLANKKTRIFSSVYSFNEIYYMQSFLFQLNIISFFFYSLDTHPMLCKQEKKLLSSVQL